VSTCAVLPLSLASISAVELAVLALSAADAAALSLPLIREGSATCTAPCERLCARAEGWTEGWSAGNLCQAPEEGVACAHALSFLASAQRTGGQARRQLGPDLLYSAIICSWQRCPDV
jgi:hypothetical protein